MFPDIGGEKCVPPFSEALTMPSSPSLRAAAEHGRAVALEVFIEPDAGTSLGERGLARSAGTICGFDFRYRAARQAH